MHMMSLYRVSHAFCAQVEIAMSFKQEELHGINALITEPSARLLARLCTEFNLLLRPALLAPPRSFDRSLAQ